MEAERLLPTLLEYKSNGAAVNVLYGVPLGPSQSKRLGAVGKELGSGSITAMIDDVDQLPALETVRKVAGSPPSIFVKIDTGYHRAGREPGSPNLKTLLEEVERWERAGELIFKGYYSHASDSYGKDTPEAAMSRLVEEVSICVDLGKIAPASLRAGRKPVISVGASPTVVSVQNIETGSVEAGVSSRWEEVLRAERSNFEIELHAGVYPLLDMQQIATNARHFGGVPEDSIALTVLAEVRSVYSERQPQEALIAAGSLALGREPCRTYSGWGILTPYGIQNDQLAGGRLIVQRISQEHGIVAFDASNHNQELPLRVGQKVRIWPNHACIAGAGFGWYLIVDSDSEAPNTIIDVWVRWRGW
jgi:D-serine ammonia-lyase